MPTPTEGQILHWISDQVQRDSCLEAEAANHYAGGLLTGWRLAKNDPKALMSEVEARRFAGRAMDADRAMMERT